MARCPRAAPAFSDRALRWRIAGPAPYLGPMTTLSPQSTKVRLGKNMRASLEYAVRVPHKWHDIGKGRAARMAVRRLALAGLVEVRAAFNRFRVRH